MAVCVTPKTVVPGGMGFDHQAGVGFRKFAIENCVRPIEGHHSKACGEH